MSIAPFGASVIRTIQRLGQDLIVGTNTGLYSVANKARDAAVSLEKIVPEISQVWSLYKWGDSLLVAATGGVYELRRDAAATFRAKKVFSTEYAYRTIVDPATSALYIGTQNGVSWMPRFPAGWGEPQDIESITQPVRSLALSSDGTLWAGTGEQTVYHIIQRGAVVHRFGAESGIPAGNAYVYKVGGQLMIGTSNGLYEALDTPAGLQLDITDSLPDVFHTDGNDIFRLREDENGNIIARNGDHTGIAFRRADGTYSWDEATLKPFGDGVAFALLPDANGVFWIGRSGDLLRWDTRIKAQSADQAAIKFGAMRLGHRPLRGSWYRSPNQDLPFTMGDNTLRTEYALPFFRTPQATQYSTRLVGFTSQFSDWSTTGYKEFTSLPPGRYELDVQARDVYGRVTQSTGPGFVVQPPWFLAPAAKAAYGLIAVLTLIFTALLSARWRSAKLESHNLRLQVEVDQQTRKLTEQAEQLRRLDRSKTDFFTNVSHEFRTPLTLTIGPLEDVLGGRHGKIGDAMRDALAMARRNAGQILELIGQLLEVNRLESGEGRLTLSRTDLNAQTQDIARRFCGLAERERIHFSTDLPDAPLYLWLDARAIHRVLENLLSNAFKYTPGGGAINLTLRECGEWANLMVIDTGRGIPEAALPRVFDRFYRAADEAVAAEIGTGIGLSLSKELVELHGGTIIAQSEHGRGSCFVVNLKHGREHLPKEWFVDLGEAKSSEPAKAMSAPAVPTPAVPTPAEPDPDPTPVDRTTILVVDDNPEIRSFVRGHLEGEFCVLEAENGRDGVSRALAELPDLIVSDVMMPELDGFGLVRELRSDPSTDCIPIILLTAKATTHDTIDGIKGGADEYLTKPFYAAELLARVKALIQMRLRLRLRFAEQPPPAGPQEAEQTTAFVSKLNETLAAHMGDCKFNVEALASAMAMDRTTLFRHIKSELRATPVAVIRRFRLQQALRLLREQAGSVSEVAYGVGFESLSYFTRAFSKEFGFPPSQTKPTKQDVPVTG